MRESRPTETDCSGQLPKNGIFGNCDWRFRPHSGEPTCRESAKHQIIGVKSRILGFAIGLRNRVAQGISCKRMVLRKVRYSQSRTEPTPARTEQAHSFTCRRNGDNTLIAVDLHYRLQSSGAAANTREKLLRAGTLHEKRLKQFRIVRLGSASFRLSFTRDR